MWWSACTPYRFAAGVDAASATSSSSWFEQWSILFGAVAAFLALASLVAQFRETYWSRPVVLLDTSLSGSPEGWDAVIVAANVGERAVTITRSGWWFSFGTHWEDINEANEAVKLPCRLEPHDAVVFQGRMGAAALSLQGTRGSTTWPVSRSLPPKSLPNFPKARCGMVRGSTVMSVN